MSNSQLEERQERDAKERIAKYLEISVDELDELEYDEGDETSEDGLTCTYHLTFSETNPPELMGRIAHLEGSTVYIPAWWFETDGPEEP